MPAQQDIWLWDAANGVWVQAPAVVVTNRMTATGPVAAGAHKLYWVSMKPSAVNSEAALTDNLDGAGDPVFDTFNNGKDQQHLILNPPMPFATGIYLKTFTKLTSMIFGYV